MSVPSFDTVEKLFEEFGIDFRGSDTYSRMYKAIKTVVLLSDDMKKDTKMSIDQFTHLIVHSAFNAENDEYKISNKIFEEISKKSKGE